MSATGFVVNGRFLGAPPTGIGRVGRTWLATVLRAGLADLEVWAPPGVDDPLVDRHVAGVTGRLGGLVWEQAVLPLVAGSRPVLSLANTAPVAKRRAVTTVHDLAPLDQPAWFHRRMQLYARITLGAARRAERVVTVSSVVADDLIARGVRAERVRVVHPAVDARFRPAASDAVATWRAQHGLGDDPYLVVVGAFDPRKDAAIVVEAHARLLASFPHRLVLVGAPHPNLGRVDLPRWPTVVYRSRVDDDELVTLLTGACALAFPSRAEGFGLPPLEAMACGTPAVVADLPVLRESTGGAATFVPVGDVGRWTDALAAALAGALPNPGPVARTVEEAARDLATVLADLA